MSDSGNDERDYKIALAGSLPGEQANGWDDDAIKASLDGDRARIRYARVAYNVMSAKEMTASGKRVLTIQLHRIEPVSDDLSEAEGRELVRMFEQRTGQTTLFADSNRPDDDELDPYSGVGDPFSQPE